MKTHLAAEALHATIEAAIAEVEQAPHDEACPWFYGLDDMPLSAEDCNCWRGRVLAILRGENEDRN